MPAVRGPDGRFLSKDELAELEASESQAALLETNNLSNEPGTAESGTNQKGNSPKEHKTMSTIDAVETVQAGDTTIEFVDDLPKVSRQREGGGKWAERLEPLLDRQGRWAKVFGPTPNPHATVNNLRSGNVATGDVNVDEFSFAGRILGSHTETQEDPETGEEVEVEVKEGYVFARYDTAEQREEREADQAKRAEARAKGQEASEDEEDEIL